MVITGLGQPRRLLVDVLHHEGDGRGRGERRLSRHHLEQDHSEGVQIAPGVDPLAHRLLWREVPRRSADEARLRQGLLLLTLRGLRDAEVQDLDEVALTVDVGDEDVVRLEVSVNDPRLMGLGERLADLLQHSTGALGLDPLLTAQQVRERLPAEVLHGQVESAVLGPSEVKDANGIRVL